MAYAEVEALVSDIHARPGIRAQLGSAAYEELIEMAVDPLATRINSIWAETIYPFVLAMLVRECPEHKAQIHAMRAAVEDARYKGPRVDHRIVSCPWCGDSAVIKGPYTADCWSCGTVGRRCMR